MYSKPGSGNPNPSPDTRFKAGNCANPGGRPKGLAKRVRDLVDVDELVAFLLQIQRGEPLDSLPGKCSHCGQPGPVTYTYPKANDRLAAARELADRGWGKPMQSVELSGPEGGPIPLSAQPIAWDYSRLTDEELTQLEALLAKCALGPGEEAPALPTPAALVPVVEGEVLSAVALPTP